MREQVIRVLREHANANIALHVANVEFYLRNPVGVGEHSDIMEAMQGELDKVAAHMDRLEVLDTFFVED
jgi:hypothetical protein